jgi:hypothetical protein
MLKIYVNLRNQLLNGSFGSFPKHIRHQTLVFCFQLYPECPSQTVWNEKGVRESIEAWKKSLEYQEDLVLILATILRFYKKLSGGNPI